MCAGECKGFFTFLCLDISFIQGDSLENNEHEDKCEIHNLKNEMMDLENEMVAKERRINYLEEIILNKKCKKVPCQSASTQVNILEKRNLNMT